MGFFNKLKDIFSPIDNVQIDFINHKFVASSDKNGKPVSAKKLAASPLLADYTFEKPIMDEPALLLSMSAAKRLYDDASRGVFMSSKTRIVFSTAASTIRFQELRNEWAIEYIFDLTARLLRRTLPNDVIELAPGYFFKDSVIWWIADLSIAKMSNKLTVQGADILSFAKLDDDGCLRCTVRISEKAYAGHISIQSVSEDRRIAKWTPTIQPGTGMTIADLTGYIISDNTLYIDLPADIRSSVFAASDSVTLMGAEIPAFAQKYQSLILEFGDESAKAALDSKTILLDRNTLKLVLHCKCDVKNGVGKAVAIPMLQYDGGMIPAKEVSEGIANGYSQVGEKWVTEEALLELGIGPLGRLANGALLEPIKLRPDEILNRGGGRLVGPWSGMLFDESGWVESGAQTDLFDAHLDFLRAYGISGGTFTPGITIAEVFCRTVHKIQLALGSSGKALILMRKESYDLCKKIYDFKNVSVYLNQKSDPPFPNKFSGVVLCLYNNLDKLPPILSAQWDMLWLVGPDDVFKTNRSATFANTKKISAKIRLGLFSLGFASFSTQQQTAISELLRYENLREQSVWQYLIRDVSKTLTLPKRYVFIPQAVVPAKRLVAVELSGIEDRGVAIPERRTINTSYGSVNITISSSFESRGGAFRTQARELASRSVNRAVFVPFMSYWPTYSSMTTSQQQWFFYWRTQVRAGNYIQTDLSYIFVYVYELINGVGYNDDEDGFNKLITLWKAYRQDFPKLDNYLPDWILDFAVLHKLSNRISEIASTGVLPSGSVANILVQQLYVEQNRPMDLALYKRIASYRIERSKFYMDGYGPIVDQKTEEVIRCIDAAMRERFQKNLLQMFYPSTTSVEKRMCYTSAVYDGSASYTLKYSDFLNHKPLIDFMDSVLRYTENRLREQMNYTGRLRGITLDELWKNLIDDTLGVVKVAETVSETVQKQKVKISLNANALLQLRSESEDIRTRLINGTEQVSEPEKELLTDLRQIMSLMRECDKEQRCLLQTIYDSGWACEEAVLRRSLQITQPTSLMEGINRISARKVGVPVLTVEAGQFVVEDDFRDEFDYIYNTPELMKDVEEYQVEPASFTEDNSMSAFLGTLDSFYLEILRLLTTASATRHTLDEMSNLHGTMTDLVLDEINEAFQTEYDDLLLDTETDPPTVMEEHQGAIRKYFEEVA